MSTMDEKSTEVNELQVFSQCYKMCCRSENIIPLKNLLSKTNETLDFCIDRIKYSDWAPIFIALSEDLSLHCLTIRCRHPIKNILEHIDNERLAMGISKYPVILTKFMLTNLMDSISHCVSHSSALTMIQIEGLPLPSPYINSITDSLSVNQSLNHISLQHCRIGDTGCQKLCTALRSAYNIVTLNLSACCITSQGGVYLAELIKYLKIYRYSENWKQTLRYQNPDLDSMTGLRRITLSENPDFGDNGLISLIEVLMDDLWIKAIDVQQCGLTEMVVKNCNHLLEINSTLRVLDLRYNAQLSLKSIGHIALVLRKNENNSIFDNSWITVKNSILNKDQKVQANLPKAKSMLRREKTVIQSHMHSSLAEKNSEKKNNESVAFLKEQLKQEVTLRHHLEALNERLLKQIKELKMQQISNWKNSGEVNEENERKPTKTVHSCTINLNEACQQTDQPKKTCHTHNKVINYFNKKDPDSNQSHSDGENMKKELGGNDHLTRKIKAGADILEKLLEQRLFSISKSKEDMTSDANDFSSDSSVTSDMTILYTENIDNRKKGEF